MGIKYIYLLSLEWFKQRHGRSGFELLCFILFWRQAWCFINVIVCISFFHKPNFTSVLAFYFHSHFKNYQKIIEMQISWGISLAKIIQNHCAALLYVFHIAFSELKKYSFNQLQGEHSDWVDWLILKWIHSSV